MLGVMSKRCRLTADRWRELIERQGSSGLSVKAFCRREGVAVSTFFAWRRKLRAAPTFVELTGEVEAADASDSTDGHDAEASGFSAPIELVLPGGVTVHVWPGFDASTLRRLVEALS